VRRFGEIDSTNRYLVEQARQGAPEGTVAVADHQTAGRGRLGRTWVAPPGSSLLLSVLLRPTLPPERLHLVTAVVALAAAGAVDEVAGFRPGLKWPNDLVVDDRKLAGVLAEGGLPASGSGSGAPAVVVGIGINLNWPDDLPDELAPIAVAVNHVTGHAVDAGAVLDALLAQLDRRYGDWTAVASEYRRSCVTIGRDVRVELGDETFTGTAADVSDDGQLLVDVGMCLRTVAAGDVIHLFSPPP
jgi:BirA family biotin operon repressor/biotin-[acetyl-CoA-carboxylase] ligase